MNPQTYDRWLEVSFFYFCQDIINTAGGLMDLMDLIEALAPIGKYDSVLVKQLVQDVLASYRVRPSREELALLCHKAEVPNLRIRELLKMGNHKLYKIIEEDKEDPRVFYPRLTADQLKLIHQFMKTLERIRKAGLI